MTRFSQNSKKYLSLLVIGSISAISGCAPNSTAQDYTDMVHDLTGGLITLKSTKNQGTEPTYIIESNTIQNYKPIINLQEKASVDVDLAAARLKRVYHFQSNEDLAKLRSSGSFSKGVLADTISENGHEWESIPGTYYKMGRGVSGDVFIVELEKNGDTTTLFLTYKALETSPATTASINELFQEIKDVAEGKIR